MRACAHGLPQPGPAAPQAALPQAATALLRAYAGRLSAATARVNLTALRRPAEIEQRHLGESLALVRLLQEAGMLPPCSAVIDVGSGGGLPGIPLAIVRADLRVTLLEATAKKAAFLRDTVAQLGLASVAVLAARAEDAGHDPDQREQYDVAVARAVAPLNVLAELMLPLVRPGGRMAAVKGSRVHEEVAVGAAAVERCGGRIERVLPLGGDTPHPLFVVLAAKVAPTPPELPRRAGMPAKRPLA